MQFVKIAEFSKSSERLIDSMVVEAPNCLAYTNFLEVNESLGRHHCDHLYVAGQQTAPEIRLHRLPADIVLATRADEDFIVLQGERALEDQIRPGWTADNVAAIIPEATVGTEASYEAVLLARYGLRTWGHWLIELLPKAICVERAYPRRFRYVVPESLMTDPYLRPMRQSIEAYGIGRERLVALRQDIKYRFTSLFAVSPVFVGAIPPQVAAGRRSSIPASHRLAFLPKKVAFLRRETPTRNLTNAQTVFTYLEARGWSLIDLGLYDFADQVRIFAACDSIVSVLGSGLAGLTYARDGVRVVTLAPGNWGDSFFYSVIRDRRAPLSDVRGVSTSNDAPGANYSAFSVEISDLERGIRALGISVEPATAHTHVELPPTYHRLLETALQLRNAGRLHEAEMQLRRAVERAPDEPIIYMHLVDFLFWQNKTEEAVRVAQQGLALYPSTLMFRLIQDHLSRLARHAEAAEFSLRETAINAQDSEAFSRLGHALCRVERFDEAAVAFARALQLRGNDLGLHLALSSALTRGGRYEDACKAAEAGSAAYPESPEPLLWLARILRHRGMELGAADALNRVIALQPNNAEALRLLGDIGPVPEPHQRPHVLPDRSLEPNHMAAVATPDHVQFLSLVKRILRPRTYVEVGVADGATFLSDPLPDFLVGIDPNLELGGRTQQLRRCRNLLLMRLTSDDAFGQLLSQRMLGERRADLAFVDGLHHCDVVLRDIANCASISREGAFILVHDIFPGNEQQASRAPTPGIWMGDVFKVVPVTWRHLAWVPNILVHDVPPSGMFILRVVGDMYHEIFSKYKMLVSEMEKQDFNSSMGIMRARSVSVTSLEFAAFIESGLANPAHGETTAQGIIRAMMAVG